LSISPITRYRGLASSLTCTLNNRALFSVPPMRSINSSRVLDYTWVCWAPWSRLDSVPVIAYE